MTFRAAWTCTALLGLACPAYAEDCRLALVLALDVSASVDRDEDQLQRGGLARALVAPEVERAFLAGPSVALYIFEWSGPQHQVTVPPGWQIVESKEDLIRIAASLAVHPPGGPERYYKTTAVGSALAYAARALQEAPSCWTRTVDVAGDGANNQGDEPRIIYGGHLLEEVTVNALVIGGALRNSDQLPGDEDKELVAWFEAEVLHGPGAFSVLAEGYPDYERAMTAKLLRELELPVVGGSPIAEPRG